MKNNEVLYIQSRLKEHNRNFRLKSEVFADAIISGVRDKVFQLGDVLPSVNKLTTELDVSRKTVVSGYNLLKEKGIVGTRERVGYYVASENTTHRYNILMIFYTFNQYIQVFFNAFVEKLGKQGKIEVALHNANPNVFRALLRDNINRFDKIIVSGFNHAVFRREIKKVSNDKLILFSRLDGYEGSNNYYVQDFYKGTLGALQQGVEVLKKYKNFYLLYNKKDWNFPRGIVDASLDFCKEHGMRFLQANDYKSVNKLKNSVFFIVNDMDLVGVLERVEKEGLILGLDAGLVSYNESPIKRVIRQGITTISVDFAEMGERVAHSLIHSENNKEILETRLIKRNSL
ncbi:MAG: GntR family transcriptional regulator [Bacteroidales bacterium]